MLVAELPFDLVEVKLAAPQIRPGTVAKADVIARLCSSRSPFATVVAPAGYGKTTLLARWAEADPRPFAWVALDGGDDDARRVPALCRGRDPPRRAGLGGGVRRPVGPRRIHLDETRPARRERACCAGAPAGAGARRSAGRRQSVVSRRACGAVRVRSGRVADRDRQQGHPGAAACPLACARIGGRDRRRRPPAR